jgi:hypothetical protein
MKINANETSLVVAGAWNPAIITPPWVQQHILNRQPTVGHNIQVFLPAGQGLAFEAPRFALEEFSFSVRPELLLILPKATQEQELRQIEDVVASIIRHLKHTPINGIGHNFEFRSAAPSIEQQGIFTVSRQDISDNLPAGWNAVTSVLSAAFTNAAGNTFVNIQRQIEGGSLVVKMNFHHPVTSADQALSILSGENGYNRMAGNLELAKSLIALLYGTSGDDDE